MSISDSYRYRYNITHNHGSVIGFLSFLSLLAKSFMVSVNFKIEKHSTRRVNIRLALDWLFEQRSLELIIRDFFFF